ncbi:MAG: hypothetical protein V4543_00700 [Bacteroidota bacterium]
MTADNYQKVVLTTVIGLGVAGVGYTLLRSSIKETQVTTAEQTGLDAGTASNFAKRLQMSFGNDMMFDWGTDEEAVYAIFREIPSKRAYADVQKSYKLLYSSDLNARLQEELSTEEYLKVQQIYNAKKA